MITYIITMAIFCMLPLIPIGLMMVIKRYNGELIIISLLDMAITAFIVLVIIPAMYEITITWIITTRTILTVISVISWVKLMNLTSR